MHIPRLMLQSVIVNQIKVLQERICFILPPFLYADFIGGQFFFLNTHALTKNLRTQGGLERANSSKSRGRIS